MPELQLRLMISAKTARYVVGEVKPNKIMTKSHNFFSALSNCFMLLLQVLKVLFVIYAFLYVAILITAHT